MLVSAVSLSTLSFLTEREMVYLLPGQKALIDCRFTKCGPGGMSALLELHMLRHMGMSKLRNTSPDKSGNKAAA